MYESYYGLTGLPFQLGPDPKFFFGSRVHQKAMAYLTYGLNQGEGFIIITGDIGAGKSTLVANLMSTLDTRKFVAAKVVSTQLEADDLLRMVAAEFGIAAEDIDKATLLRRLENFLHSQHTVKRRSVLIIDEAQNLTFGGLEELRMLLNFQAGNRPLLQSFLLGQPQFRAVLSRPELEQLRQRVIASYHLGPLDPDETKGYIEHRLRLVGWTGDPSFTHDSFVIIYRNTDGVPRRINALCSRLLLYGYLEETHVIDGPVVDQVANDMVDEIAQVTAPPPPASVPAGGARRAIPRRAVRARPQEPPSSEAEALAISDLDDRVRALENHIKSHERSIRQTRQIIAEYLEREKG